MTAPAAALPLRLHLLTGALGSGKTTILNRLLKSPALKRVLVLVNEFGDIAIDHEIITQITENVITLASGCVCCSISGDLQDTLNSLAGQRIAGQWPYAEDVILETTGLADPIPILQLMAGDDVLQRHASLGNIITVVDATRDYAADTVGDVLVNQIAQANILLLAKTDLASAADQSRTRALISTLNTQATVIDLATVENATPLCSTLLAPPALVDRKPLCFGNTPISGIISVALRFPNRVDEAAFQRWLQLVMQSFGERILRLKGIVPLSSGMVFVHGVGPMLHAPQPVDRPGLLAPRLVLIGRNLMAQSLQRSLDLVLGAAVPALPHLSLASLEKPELVPELAGAAARLRALLPQDTVKSQPPELYWNIHNPWSLAGQAFEAWAVLEVLESEPLVQSARKWLGPNLHLAGSEIITPRTHWLRRTQNAYVAMEARYWPVAPQQAVSILIPLWGSPTEAGAQVTGQRLDRARSFTALDEWGALLITYADSAAGWDRAAANPAHILRDVERPLESVATAPLWLVSGERNPHTNYVTGFSRPRAGWLERKQP